GLVPLALSRGVAGKEILYPVAVVILGGLISSTLLNMVVLPSLFFKFGSSAYSSDAPREADRIEVGPDPQRIGG
ncbi:MAG: efflux RND transporter permease subunit, partial [Acidobacteriota bacterium]